MAVNSLPLIPFFTFLAISGLKRLTGKVATVENIENKTILIE